MSPSRRKYLESINIAPIDLQPLVADHDSADAKHFAALTILLDELKNLRPKKPWEWKPISIALSTGTTEEFDRRRRDIAYQAKLFEDQLGVLETDRLSYPGWLVCPNGIRQRLNRQINDPWPTPKNIAAMQKDKREKLLYEIAWRDSVTLDVINPALLPDMLSVCDPAKSNALSKQQQMEIALVLLQSTRWLSDLEAEDVEEKTSFILQKHAKHWPESNNHLLHHNAFLARDNLDFTKLAELTAQIEPLNPIWQMRKAALLSELGQFETSHGLIEQAYSELQRQYRYEPNSIKVLSQLAWTHWLRWQIRRTDFNNPHENFPNSYRDSLCEPLPYLESLEETVKQGVDKQKKQSIEPSFSLGSYRDHDKTISFGAKSNPALYLDGLARVVGIPTRVGDTISVDLLGKISSSAASLRGLLDYRYSLAINAAQDDGAQSIKDVFSQIGTALIPQPIADRLLEQCTQAIQYWQQKITSQINRRMAVNRLRVFVEVLARLSTRASVAKAIEVFRLGIALGQNPSLRYRELFAVIDNLLKNALRSIPEARHQDVLHDALSFPLEQEIGLDRYARWPNPLVRIPGIRTPSNALDRRIDEIIDRIAPLSESSALALTRLLPLLQKDYLTYFERQKIAEKVWGAPQNFQNIPVTGLYSSALHLLPAENPSAIRALVAASLFKDFDFNKPDAVTLRDIAHAAQNQESKLAPDETTAVHFFDHLVAWRSAESDHPFDLFNEQSEISSAIGEALVYSIVEALPKAALTAQNLDRLCLLLSDCKQPILLRAMPYFACSEARLGEKVERAISEALQKLEPSYSAYAAQAILQWRKIQSVSEAGATKRLITRLIHLIVSGRTRGLANLLDIALELVNCEWLGSVETNLLSESLPQIFETCSYANVDERISWEIIDFPLVRIACVKLASSIMQSQQDCNEHLESLVAIAQQDPLPEVRFATSSPE